MVLALTDRGEDVVVLDNLVTGFDWLVSPSADLVQGDVADGELLARLIETREIDAIIHFAGSVVVPDPVADPLGSCRNNTSKTRARAQTGKSA